MTLVVAVARAISSHCWSVKREVAEIRVTFHDTRTVSDRKVRRLPGRPNFGPPTKTKDAGPHVNTVHYM